MFTLTSDQALNAAADSAQVVTHPAPEGESLSPDYEVQAAGQKLAVYTARVLDAPFAGKQWDYGGDYSFANFDMSGPVALRIVSKQSLRSVVIRPLSSGIKPVLEGDHTLILNLDRPRKLSIEPDGKKAPLLLFANPLEVEFPKPNDKAVVYFGPGVHKPEKIVLESNQTLYLDGGAVVKAEVLARGTNIRICGRGILDGSDWAWRTGPVGNLIAIRNSTDVHISGITLRGSSHWSIVPENCRRVTIRNVKICNSRVQNDDGINPCNSQDVLISDCFIRSDDDCVALKGLGFSGSNSNVEGIIVENSILWCDRARIFLLGHESRAEFMRNITLRNLDIIHFTMTPFLLEPGEDMRLEDVSIEDIRIHGEAQRQFIRLRPVVNQYMRKQVPGHIRNIHFKDIMVDGRPGEYLVQIEGADAEHTVQDVSFTDVSIVDAKLSKGSKRVRMGNYTGGISFSATAGETDRIGIRKDGRYAYFCSMDDNKPFFVKGMNYIRLRHGDHATFEAAVGSNPAYYDREQAVSMLKNLAENGYNTVRVFIIGRSSRNPGIGGHYQETQGLYGPYMENVMDFLRLARAHGIYVLPTFGDGELPRNRYYRDQVKNLAGGINAICFTPEGIAAKQQYVVDFLTYIKTRDRSLLDVLLAVQLQNELHVRCDAWPFTQTRDTLRMPNGKSYDMANTEDRQRLMDQGLNHYHNTLVMAIKAVAPELLVCEGVFTLRAVGKTLDTHKGVFPMSSGDKRFPPTATVLGRSHLDFIDMHFYRTRRSEQVSEAFPKDMDSMAFFSEEMDTIRETKPVILGEFGAFRHIDDSFAGAADNLRDIRDLAIEHHMMGIMMWTYDTFEQKRLYPAMEDKGAFLKALSDFSVNWSEITNGE